MYNVHINMCKSFFKSFCIHSKLNKPRSCVESAKWERPFAWGPHLRFVTNIVCNCCLVAFDRDVSMIPRIAHVKTLKMAVCGSHIQPQPCNPICCTAIRLVEVDVRA